MTRSPESPGRSSFAGDVLTLASGTTLAQILTVLTGPVLTRLYGPDAFGLSALFLSLASLVGVIACFRYELSIMLPKQDEEAANLLGASLISAALVSILTLLAVWLGQGMIAAWLSAPGLAPYLWLLPPFVFLNGVFLALNYWNSRRRRYARLAAAQVTISAATISSELGAGFAGYATGGSLIMAKVLGSAISSLLLLVQTGREDGHLLKESLSGRLMLAGVRRYRKFPLVDAWSALFNALSWQAPALLLSAFFSAPVVGFYALGSRMLYLPMNLIGSSIAQVFFQRAAEAEATGRLPVIAERVFRALVALGLFPMLMIALMGRDMVAVVFGESWAEAGVYAQILSPWAFLWFVSSPLANTYIVRERQELGLKFNIANFMARFLSILMGGLLGSARISILLISLSGLFMYGYLLKMIISSAGVSRSTVIGILGSNIALFLPAGTVILLLRCLNASPLLQMAVAGALAAAYFYYISRSDPVLKMLLERKEIFRLMQR